MLMKFLCGSLPWEGYGFSTYTYATFPQRNHIFGYATFEYKKHVARTSLFADYPEEFRQYFDYCTALAFDEQPDYRLALSHHIISFTALLLS